MRAHTNRVHTQRLFGYGGNSSNAFELPSLSSRPASQLKASQSLSRVPSLMTTSAHTQTAAATVASTIDGERRSARVASRVDLTSYSQPLTQQTPQSSQRDADDNANDDSVHSAHAAARRGGRRARAGKLASVSSRKTAANVDSKQRGDAVSDNSAPRQVRGARQAAVDAVSVLVKRERTDDDNDDGDDDEPTVELQTPADDDDFKETKVRALCV
jgi:hypothetical protein